MCLCCVFVGEQGETLTPSVIEPSFGIGRIIYCLYEHSFYVREGEDEQKTVFRFRPLVAPIKCTVFPVVQRPEFDAVAVEISHALTRAGLANKIDTTGTTIGKRYARTDELGSPFAITVDGTVSLPSLAPAPYPPLEWEVVEEGNTAFAMSRGHGPRCMCVSLCH